MSYFPFFSDISGKPGLIVGGGAVALRKIEKLLPFGPQLTVIAPEFCPEILAMPQLTRLCREFSPGDEAGMALVIAATNCREINRRISQCCQADRIPVNVVDDPALCSFLFPSLVQRGALTVGISTGGCSPTAAICLKETINGLLPDRFDEILEFLHQKRAELRSSVPDASSRHQLLRKLFCSAMEHGRPLTDQETAQLYREALS